MEANFVSDATSCQSQPNGLSSSDQNLIVSQEDRHFDRSDLQVNGHFDYASRPAVNSHRQAPFIRSGHLPRLRLETP